MSRKPRIYSNSGYMHLILRGIGQQIIFEERSDYQHCLSLLKRFSGETFITICAYCLMDNHIHLLIHDPQRKMADFMKKFGVGYSYFYNSKYSRTGHLFQNRYWSEAIEDEKYLLTVFRYILNNPAKAGICPADRYQWSSFDQYAGRDTLVDTGVFRDLIGDWDAYRAFMAADDGAQVMDISKTVRDDAWAKDVITRVLQIQSGTQLRLYDRHKRNDALKLLKREGLSLRQIERLTGISKSVIQRA